MNTRWMMFVLALLSVLALAACAAQPTAVPQPTTAATPTGAATTAPTVAPTTAPTTAATLPPKSTVAATTAATLAPKSTVAPTTASAGPTSQPGTFGKADLDKIFPPGKGQDLVFENCTNCHSWVPIVLAGFDTNAWEQNKLKHRSRVPQLSDADFNYLYDYIEKNFPAGHPVPTNIPEDLLKEWTSY